MTGFYVINDRKRQAMKLYELDQEIEKVEEAYNEYAEEHAGDVTDFPYEAQYEALQGERDEKILNLGSWFKNLSAESKAFADEIKVLQQKKKVRDNKMNWVKDFINSYLKVGEKINDTRVQLSWRKSESIQINDRFDMSKLSSFFKVVTEDVNKSKVKEHLKQGEKFEGIELLQKNNLQIK